MFIKEFVNPINVIYICPSHSQLVLNFEGNVNWWYICVIRLQTIEFTLERWEKI